MGSVEIARGKERVVRIRPGVQMEVVDSISNRRVSRIELEESATLYQHKDD
jgi:hypothetical protein